MYNQNWQTPPNQYPQQSHNNSLANLLVPQQQNSQSVLGSSFIKLLQHTLEPVPTNLSSPNSQETQYSLVEKIYSNLYNRQANSGLNYRAYINSVQELGYRLPHNGANQADPNFVYQLLNVVKEKFMQENGVSGWQDDTYSQIVNTAMSNKFNPPRSPTNNPNKVGNPPGLFDQLQLANITAKQIIDIGQRKIRFQDGHKVDQTIDPESYSQLTYYQYHTISHLYHTITPNHCRMIKKDPYINVAISALGFVTDTIRNTRSTLFQDLINRAYDKFMSGLAMFNNNMGSTQPALTYYQIQSWIIIMVTVYKCIQDNYDAYTRRMFKNVCIFFSNELIVNSVACLRWLENNRSEIRALEDMEKFMIKADSITYEVYQHRDSFLKGKSMDEVPNFKLINLTSLANSRRKIVNIWISGFLSEDMDKKSHWKSLAKLMPDSQIYAVQWTSDCITNLIKFIGKACFQVLTADKIKDQLHRKFTDNPFIPAIDTAIMLGKYLAEMLVRLFPCQFVNIVGYSLGSEMILSCIDRLIQIKKQSLLNNVYILGGVTDCGLLETAIAKSRYPLCIHNCYTPNDMVLSHVLSLCKPDVKPCGLSELKKLEGHSIINRDCSAFISGHLAYMNAFNDVGRDLEMSKQ